MSYFIKKLAYIFLYLPILFIPNSNHVDFADKKRIERLHIVPASLISLFGLLIVVGLIYFVIILVI